MSLLKSKCDRKRRAKFVKTTQGLVPAPMLLAPPMLPAPLPRQFLPSVVPPADQQLLVPPPEQATSNAIQQAFAAQSSADEEILVEEPGKIRMWLLAASAGFAITIGAVTKAINFYKDQIRMLEKEIARQRILIRSEREKNQMNARSLIIQYDTQIQSLKEEIKTLRFKIRGQQSELQQYRGFGEEVLEEAEGFKKQIKALEEQKRIAETRYMILSEKKDNSNVITWEKRARYLKARVLELRKTIEATPPPSSPPTYLFPSED